MNGNDRTKLDQSKQAVPLSKLDQSKLAVPVPDRRRANMHEQIARVHKEILQVKWRAQTAGKQFGLLPSILPHLEESLAFLAEEMLALQVAFEKGGVIKFVPEKLSEAELKKLKRLLEEDNAKGGNLVMMEGVPPEEKERIVT